MSKTFAKMGWLILVALLCIGITIFPACGGEGEGEGTTNPYIGSGALDVMVSRWASSMTRPRA
jgi:hypothetical protein